MLEISVVWVEELRKKLSDIDLKRIDSMWIKEGTLELQREAKLNIPPNVDTGNMRRQVLFENLADVWYVRAEAPYSIYIHEGTKYFHKPNPFMKKAKENRQDAIVQHYKDLLTEHIAKLWLSN